MKIYIAGKITGLDIQDAAVNFTAAQIVLERFGHEALNPLFLVDQTEGRQYRDYLLDALRILMTEADGVYMLDNWRDSKGARLEHAYAEIYGLPIFYEKTKLVTENTKIKPFQEAKYCGGCGVFIHEGMPFLKGYCEVCYH